MRYVIIDGRGIIPDRVTKIDNSAFYGCSRLESIVIPDSVTLIEEAAFADCEYLQSIVIPDSVTKIEAWAFSSCNNLTSIIVSKNNPEYKSENNCILTKDGKTLVLCRNHNIPDSVTCIIGGAFSGYSSLESIVIPDSVTKIEGWAFEQCTSLQLIVIPDSVTEIEECAFGGCGSLQSITIVTQEKDPDLSRERIEYLLQALSEYSKEFSLRVPINCEEAYRHHPAFEGKFKKVTADIDV